jgi:hypothetical protein
MLRQWYANLERQRSHECERCTHECVRHKGGEFFMGNGTTECETHAFPLCLAPDLVGGL